MNLGNAAIPFLHMEIHIIYWRIKDSEKSYDRCTFKL